MSNYGLRVERLEHLMHKEATDDRIEAVRSLRRDLKVSWLV